MARCQKSLRGLRLPDCSWLEPSDGHGERWALVRFSLWTAGDTCAE